MSVIINGTTGITTPSDTTPIVNSSTTLSLQTGGTTAITVDASQNTTFVNAINTPNTFGFKNRIINGAMGISQRGTSFSSVGLSAQTYTLDRWAVTSTGANISVAQIAGIGNFQYALQLTGATSNTQAYISQRIESANIYDLAGTTATLSVVMQASSAQTVQWDIYYPTAKDNYTSTTLVSTGTFSVTTSAQIFSAQISLPSNIANGAWILFYPQNAGAFTSGTLTITGVQLEKGTTATSFDYRPYGTELGLSQRYYFTTSIYIGALLPGQSTTSYINYPSPMRVSPTIAGGGTGFTTITPTVYGVSIYQTTASSPTLTFNSEL